jgi:hypothetical protein
MPSTFPGSARKLSSIALTVSGGVPSFHLKSTTWRIDPSAGAAHAPPFGHIEQQPEIIPAENTVTASSHARIMLDSLVGCRLDAGRGRRFSRSARSRDFIDRRFREPGQADVADFARGSARWRGRGECNVSMSPWRMWRRWPSVSSSSMKALPSSQALMRPGVIAQTEGVPAVVVEGHELAGLVLAGVEAVDAGHAEDAPAPSAHDEGAVVGGDRER